MEKLEIFLNNEKLKRFEGITFTDSNNFIFYVRALLFKLLTTNKNYTVEQARIIDTLSNIFECLDN